MIVFVFIFIILLLNWRLNVKNKMPLTANDNKIYCPICLKQLDENQLFIDCYQEKYPKHYFTIISHRIFICQLELNEKIIIKSSNKYTLNLHNKEIILAPFEYCEILNIINKYLKLKSFS